MSRLLKVVFFAGAVLMPGLQTARSQTTFASITGVVTDASGSAMPNAAVSATNQETNIRTSTKSNEAGYYTIAQLKEGTYTLQVTAAGFREFVAANIVLAAREVGRVD